MKDGENTRLRVNAPHVIHETIDGEVIVINLSTGTYYSLKGSGAAVWDVLQRAPADASSIATVLERRFDAPLAVIEDSMQVFVDELRAEELLVTAEGPVEDGQAVAQESAPAHREPYERPVLEKFTDMQDLVLLDPVHEVDQTGWPHARPDDDSATVSAGTT